MEWNRMTESKPKEEGEVLFILKGMKGWLCGWAYSAHQIVLSRRTEFDFSEIEYWYPVPEMPN